MKILIYDGPRANPFVTSQRLGLTDARDARATYDHIEKRHWSRIRALVGIVNDVARAVPRAVVRGGERAALQVLLRLSVDERARGSKMPQRARMPRPA